jgi:hypothetical protein
VSDKGSPTVARTHREAVRSFRSLIEAMAFPRVM